MDTIKNTMKGGSDSSKQQQSSSQSAQSGQKEDYGDKAFSAASQKTGQNIDRDTQEKMTDTGRDMFEKGTGKNVPEKFSN
ncbi:hypothetical protein SODALDRAFT_332995 [Sodiomyces alkalinus F11]|uniref:Uncharacterized protein n=1 Tax=Sodiomyces alkalinus (strain CBS 110278 / VKM F-3762 / F11) TaxID=1314773 RepID=A0A3N2PVQ2_SODAK|nr:hypothetical protein SODALDRAFT_332995 [Sodiomyces alkalinus F11]ROT38426.1 hypothetical protein SODALDRAFT_332995 [Sodiomyces alkalinus F11]